MNKRKYAVFFLLITAYYYFLMINVKMPNLNMDEIWCYGFSQRIAEGYVIYRDFNVILTPLYFFIGSLFSKSILVFRLYGAIINAAILTTTLYTCEKFKVDKYISAVVVLATGMLSMSVLESNYNVLMILGIMIVYLSLISFADNPDQKTGFLAGISLSMLFLVKQNIPAVLIILFTIIVFTLLLIKKINLRVFMSYALGGILPVGMFMMYLYLNHGILGFVNYCILGLKSFSQYFVFQEGFLLPMLISLLVTLILFVKLIKAGEEKLQVLITLIISLSSYMFIYPLVNYGHYMCLVILNVFLLTFVFKGVTLPLSLNFSRLSLLICISGILVINAYTFIRDDGEIKYLRSSIEPYKGIYLSENDEKALLDVSNYIIANQSRGKDVGIVHVNAYAYNIVSKDCNGILDLLIKGNIGVTNMEDIKMLIDSKDSILIGEKPTPYDIEGVRDYIVQKMTKEGDVGEFEIYVKR